MCFEFVAPLFRTSVPALTQLAADERIYPLWTPYTFCRFTAMNNTYVRYTQGISQYRLLH
jgi:hypothetical protein